MHVLEHEEDLEPLRGWLRRNGSRPISADTETTGLKLWRPGFDVRLLQMGDEHTAWVLRTDRFARPAQAMLNHCGYRWVWHNAPYDLLALERKGFVDALDLHSRSEDTKILWHLIDPRARKDGGHGLKLKELARDLIDSRAPDTQNGLTAVFRKLRVPTGQVDRKGNEKTRAATKDEGWSLVSLDHPTYTLYAGLDVILTARLYRLGRQLVEKQGNTKLAEWEHDIQRIGLAMERRGALVDVPWTEQLADRWQREYEDHFARCQELGLANLNSPQQVVAALQAAGVELTRKTATGNLAADVKVLKPLAAEGMELAQEILAAKRVRKRRSAYALNMLELRGEDDRVHPSLNTLQARTGRMSIANPPFQQLPSKSGDWHIRRCVIAKPGHVLVSTDMDQVEYRIAGAFAQEPAIMQASREGRSIHKATAEVLYGPDYSDDEYKLAKNTGFCKLFGGGAAKIAETSGVDIDAATDVVRRFNESYPRLRKFARDLQNDILRDAGVDLDDYYNAWDIEDAEERRAVQRELTAGRIGYVQTPMGRWLPVEAERAYAGFNYLIQSTARDVLCRGLIECDRQGLGEAMILVVHDEVLAEVPTEEASVVSQAFSRAMSTEFKGVPLTAAWEPGNICGPSWGHRYSSEDDRAAWLYADEEYEETA